MIIYNLELGFLSVLLTKYQFNFLNMQYSIVNGVKSLPFKGGKGVCYCCGNSTVAKCGNMKIHHWSHLDLSECDKWWESEGVWHRKWKSFFPEEWHEIVNTSENNERHIADIKTSYGLVVELQNSPISIEELISRETFYNNMIWIVNGESFKKFYVLDKLPNIQDKKFSDYKFPRTKKENLGKGYFLLSENPFYFELRSYKYHSLDKINELIEESYVGHHLLDWKNSHNAWLQATKPVFIDLGNEKLYRLFVDNKFNQLNVRIYEKEDIINRIKQNDK